MTPLQMGQGFLSPSLAPSGGGTEPAYELKFLVEEDRAAEAEAWAWGRLSLDPHGVAALGARGRRGHPVIEARRDRGPGDLQLHLVDLHGVAVEAAQRVGAAGQEAFRTQAAELKYKKLPDRERELKVLDLTPQVSGSAQLVKQEVTEEDIAAFEAAYPDQLALARKLPGLTRLQAAKVFPKEDGSPTPAYRLLDLYFADYAAAIHANSVSYNAAEAGLGIGSLFFCALLFRTRLVPRFLAV